MNQNRTLRQNFARILKTSSCIIASLILVGWAHDDLDIHILAPSAHANKFHITLKSDTTPFGEGRFLTIEERTAHGGCTRFTLFNTETQELILIGPHGNIGCGSVNPPEAVRLVPETPDYQVACAELLEFLVRARQGYYPWTSPLPELESLIGPDSPLPCVSTSGTN
jgi:hypothetical protein